MALQAKIKCPHCQQEVVIKMRTPEDRAAAELNAAEKEFDSAADRLIAAFSALFNRKR